MPIYTRRPERVEAFTWDGQHTLERIVLRLKAQSYTHNLDTGQLELRLNEYETHTLNEGDVITRPAGGEWQVIPGDDFRRIWEPAN